MLIKEGSRMAKESTIRRNGAFALLVLSGILLSFRVDAQQLDDAARQSLQAQLEALEREAAALDQQIIKTQAETQTLQQQVRLFNDEIKRRELEIRRLNVAIRQAEIDIQQKSASIDELGRRIDKNRLILGRNIQQLYEYDQEHMLVVLAKNETLSDFFTALDHIRSLQAQVGGLVDA